MAKLDLLPRKEFTITLDNGAEVRGKFGTWALKRFGEKRGYKLSEIGSAFLDATLDDVLTYLLSAVEQKSREDKTPFGFTEVDCGAWIDELGGIQDTGDFNRLFNHAKDEGSATEEKKTEESS